VVSTPLVWHGASFGNGLRRPSLFRAGFGPKAGSTQAQTMRHSTHKPAHIDSERFWADVSVLRRRSEIFKL
jgi:hypothetical protein